MCYVSTPSASASSPLTESVLFLCFAADSTGTHSLYTTYQDYEIMFHVSTMLPYTLNNRQQVNGPSAGRAQGTGEPAGLWRAAQWLEVALF